MPVPEGKDDDYYLPLSAIMAFYTVAQKVVFNSDAVKDMEDEFLAEGFVCSDVCISIYTAAYRWRKHIGDHHPCKITVTFDQMFIEVLIEFFSIGITIAACNQYCKQSNNFRSNLQAIHSFYYQHNRIS